MPSPKVPEAVLDVFCQELGLEDGLTLDKFVEAFGDHASVDASRLQKALQAALAQHHKELLGDEAMHRSSGVVAQSHPKTRTVGRVVARQVVQAAIDSVMKGGE